MRPDIRTMAFEADLAIRTGDATGRTVVGRAVPFGVVVDTPDVGRESFAAGAFRRTINHGKLSRVKLCVSHRRDEPAGVCVELEERDDGLHGAWRVSRTAAGDDVLEQVRDGTLDELSVGFVPQHGRREDGAYVHTAVRLVEVSLVPWGAYGDAGAKVLAVRAGELHGTPRLDGLAEIVARAQAAPYSDAI